MEPEHLVRSLILNKALKLVTNIYAYRNAEDLDKLHEALNINEKQDKKKLKADIKKYLKNKKWKKNSNLITQHLKNLNAFTDSNYTNLSLLLALGDLDFDQGRFGALSRKSKTHFLGIVAKKSDGTTHDFEELNNFFFDKFRIGNIDDSEENPNEPDGALFSKNFWLFSALM